MNAKKPVLFTLYRRSNATAPLEEMAQNLLLSEATQRVARERIGSAIRAQFFLKSKNETPEWFRVDAKAQVLHLGKAPS